MYLYMDSVLGGTVRSNNHIMSKKLSVITIIYSKLRTVNEIQLITKKFVQNNLKKKTKRIFVLIIAISLLLFLLLIILFISTDTFWFMLLYSFILFVAQAIILLIFFYSKKKASHKLLRWSLGCFCCWLL